MVTMFDGSFTLQARTSQITDVTGTPVLASKWSAFSARVREGVTSQVQIEMNSDETGACDVNINYIQSKPGKLSNFMFTQLRLILLQISWCHWTETRGQQTRPQTTMTLL